MFRHLSLRIKLSLVFLFVGALVGAVGYYEVGSVRHLNHLFLRLIDQDFERRNALDEIRINTSAIENIALHYDQAVEEGTAHDSPQDTKAQLAQQRKALQNYLNQYEKLAQDSGSDIKAGSVDTLTRESNQIADEAQAFLEGVITAAPENRTKRQQSNLKVASDNLSATIADLTQLEDAHITVRDTEIDNSVLQLVRTILLLVVAVAAFSVALGLLVAEGLSRRIQNLHKGAARIANGDFSHPVPVGSKDEIGKLAEAFNSMADRLRDSYQRVAFETERDKTLLESLGEGLIAIDENSNIALINEYALKLLELPAREKVLGIPVNHTLTLYDERDKPLTATDTPAVLALQTLHTVDGDYTFHRKDGGKIVLHVGASPVIVNDKIAGVIMAMRDITKEKEVDRMKTEFISLASHQLRTPLSAIKWFTEMLESGDAGELSSDQKEFARNIADSTERMIALVNALLNISRIESGRIMVVPKPTDLGELVKGIVNDLKGKTSEKQQNLVISVNAELPQILLDPRLISQVYLNLLTNAVKYTPKGGEITVMISRKGDEIISQVSDNGYGIPKEQQDRVFQKFFRAANAVKIETDGTGLGLYLIKAIVESSGGKIWFQSDEGKGTTFWFTIPVSGMIAKEGEVTLDV
jgi:PAS domain S-box-containing protein